MFRRNLILSFSVSLVFGMGSSVFANASSVDSGEVGPNFIQDVGDGPYAQTSDVTIMLEKKMPPSTSITVSDTGSLEEVGETASNTALRSGQKPQTYEELEDPFAPVCLLIINIL